MNIYEKLAEARCKLRNIRMKKSGKNKFAGYEYFELGDFLTPVTEIFDELKIMSMVSFGIELATLTIINQEDPAEQITITSPMSTAKLKACHEVQNLGAVQTYLRRYLYIALMEMVEHDACDASDGVDKPKVEKKVSYNKNLVTESTDTTPISAGQVTRLCTIVNNNPKGDMETFDAWLLKKYQLDSKSKIPKMFYDEICSAIEVK